MKWLRLWTEILDDPKCNVSNMPDETFRVFILLMAYARELDNAGVLDQTESTLAWRLRMIDSALRKHLLCLRDLKIIELKPVIRFLNWGKRQFLSDDSSERVKRFRIKKRNVSQSFHETASSVQRQIQIQRQIQRQRQSIVAHPENPDIQRLSNFLFQKIIDRNPGHKTPNFNEWSNSIRLMIDTDKRDPAKIAQVIEWCQQDEFWQNNILSTKKLRKQFDQLVMRMDAGNNNGYPKTAVERRYDENMAVGQRMLKKAQEENKQNGEQGNCEQIVDDAIGSISGEKNQ